MHVLYWTLFLTHRKLATPSDLEGFQSLTWELYALHLLITLVVVLLGDLRKVVLHTEVADTVWLLQVI